MTGRPQSRSVRRMYGVLRRTAATALLLTAVFPVSPASAQSTDAAPLETAPLETAPSTPGAVLQGLDKVTARISTIPVALDEEVRFGSLSIRVRACHKTPPTEPPESTAFLEITDNRQDNAQLQIFSGWMFASSPALSALEHPVYDVWVVDCMNASISSPDKSD